MSILKRSRMDKQREAAKRLRYAMVSFLDETDGDAEYAMDIIELVNHDWRFVNE